METFKRPKRSQDADNQKFKASRDLSDKFRDKTCIKCPLYRYSEGHVCMWGNGPVPAKGMVVGNSPSEFDETMGDIPFAEGGMGANYLTGILEDAGISRDQLYITYAHKCREAPEPQRELLNRQARKECGVYLAEEMKAVRPNAVLAMGSEAFWQFSHETGIYAKRGRQFFDKKWNCWVIPTLGPMDILESPKHHVAFLSDVKKFARLVNNQLEKPKIKVVFINTIEEFRELRDKLLSFTGVITFDIETRGFVDYRDDFSAVWCAAFSTGEKTPEGELLSWVVPMEHPDSPFLFFPEQTREIVEGTTKIVIDCKTSGHNVKFDYRGMLFLKNKYEKMDYEELATWCYNLRTRAFWTEEESKKMTKRKPKQDVYDELERIATKLLLEKLK